MSDGRFTCACGAVYIVQKQASGELFVDVVRKSPALDIGMLRRERDELRAVAPGFSAG